MKHQALIEPRLVDRVLRHRVPRVVRGGRASALADDESSEWSALTGIRSPSSSIRRIQSCPPSPFHVILTKSFATGVRGAGDDDFRLRADFRADFRADILCRPSRSAVRLGLGAGLGLTVLAPLSLSLSLSLCLCVCVVAGLCLCVAPRSTQGPGRSCVRCGAAAAVG